MHRIAFISRLSLLHPFFSHTSIMASPKVEIGEVRLDPSASNSPAISTTLFRFSLILRSALFAATLASIIVMVKSKQIKEVSLPGLVRIRLVAKFNYSPSYIYFVGASSVACLYGLMSAIGCAIFLRRATAGSKIFFLLAFFDALTFGVVASAFGAGASIGYVGLKGNSHVGWVKICNMFDTFCNHIQASLILSAVASFLLISLVLTSTLSLHPRSR